MILRTCVSPEGRFVYGVHRPSFTAENFRKMDLVADLGLFSDSTPHRNTANFPSGPVHEPAADEIFEIPNAFPFRGTTYIGKTWADTKVGKPEAIFLPATPSLSFFDEQSDEASATHAIRNLARPLQLALAVSSTDARDLCCLAHLACTFCMNKSTDSLLGLTYEKQANCKSKAVIADKALFEAVANNRHLPDDYKQAMVLRPGAQGESEIVGECRHENTHVFEYLRRNSYIPWGHYAANMANDSVRYDIKELTLQDMAGMRHLYYQRTYSRLASLFGISVNEKDSTSTENGLETLRKNILLSLKNSGPMDFDRTLWGWNYGFDYTPNGYRLHASHQQIHQQYAMIPAMVPIAKENGSFPSYACGDLIADFVKAFRQETGKNFFRCYQQAIMENQRMDDDVARDRRLVVFEDDQVMVFVPKAQTSQWELQLMPKKPVGNIIEANSTMRRSLDRAVFTAVSVLGYMGARLITTIEYSKAITDEEKDQRLLIAFMPKLPKSPGAFSEAQLRWINGHYPEDFAHACRNHIPNVEKRFSS